MIFIDLGFGLVCLREKLLAIHGTSALGPSVTIDVVAAMESSHRLIPELFEAKSTSTQANSSAQKVQGSNQMRHKWKPPNKKSENPSTACALSGSPTLPARSKLPGLRSQKGDDAIPSLDDEGLDNDEDKESDSSLDPDKGPPQTEEDRSEAVPTLLAQNERPTQEIVNTGAQSVSAHEVFDEKSQPVNKNMDSSAHEVLDGKPNPVNENTYSSATLGSSHTFAPLPNHLYHLFLL